LRIIAVALVCWYVRGIVFSFSFWVLYIYELGCELKIHDITPYFFYLKKREKNENKRKQKKERENKKTKKRKKETEFE